MIPKIIHQIWIGSTEIPKEEKAMCQRVRDLHPDYEYHFWDNETVYNIDSKTSERIDFLKNSKIKKASFIVDYIKLAAVYHFGGIYLDCDIDINKKNALSMLDLKRKDLIISRCNQLKKEYVQFAFFAACKKNSYIKEVMEQRTLWYFRFFAMQYFQPKFIDNKVIHSLHDIEKVHNNIQVLDRSYFFDGKIAKHKGSLTHKKEEGLFEK